VGDVHSVAGNPFEPDPPVSLLRGKKTLSDAWARGPEEPLARLAWHQPCPGILLLSWSCGQAERHSCRCWWLSWPRCQNTLLQGSRFCLVKPQPWWFLFTGARPLGQAGSRGAQDWQDFTFFRYTLAWLRRRSELSAWTSLARGLKKVSAKVDNWFSAMCWHSWAVLWWAPHAPSRSRVPQPHREKDTFPCAGSELPAVNTEGRVSQPRPGAETELSRQQWAVLRGVRCSPG